MLGRRHSFPPLGSSSPAPASSPKQAAKARPRRSSPLLPWRSLSSASAFSPPRCSCTPDARTSALRRREPTSRSCTTASSGRRATLRSARFSRSSAFSSSSSSLSDAFPIGRMRLPHERFEVTELAAHAPAQIHPHDRLDRTQPKGEHVLLVVDDCASTCDRRDDEPALDGRLIRRDAGGAAVEPTLVELVRELAVPRHAGEPPPDSVRAVRGSLGIDVHGVGLDLGQLDVLDLPDRLQGRFAGKSELPGAHARDPRPHGLPPPSGSLRILHPESWDCDACCALNALRTGQEHAMAQTCTHLDQVVDVTPSSEGCEDCLRIGGQWLHLRLCMSCGHVGCCDNSPNRHATAHFRSRHHPLIQSYEPGEDWWYCYIDDLFFAVDDAPSFAHS